MAKATKKTSGSARKSTRTTKKTPAKATKSPTRSVARPTKATKAAKPVPTRTTASVESVVSTPLLSRTEQKAKAKSEKKQAKAEKKQAKAEKKQAKAEKKKRKKVAPVPKGYGTVTATLNQDDANATIAFCKAAFGAKVRAMYPSESGKVMHAEIQIGDSRVMLSDAVMEPARVASLWLYVPDVDSTVARAIEAGARELVPVSDAFWGDRFGRVVDPFGNFWAIATRVENLSEKQMAARGKAAMDAMAKSD